MILRRRLEALEHKINKKCKDDKENSCFLKFSCNGSTYPLERDLFGPAVPKSVAIKALLRTVGHEIVIGHDEIIFSKPDTLSIITNSLRMNVDISDELTVGILFRSEAPK